MSAFVPVDSDVRERIRMDLASNLCVEAGAGTTSPMQRAATAARSARRIPPWYLNVEPR